MVFSSPIFLFAFLPLFLAIYYVVPSHKKSLIILLGSYIFYGWWRIDFLLLLIALTVGNYICGQNIIKYRNHPSSRHWMQTGIVANLMTLAMFKYFNFGIDNLNILLEHAGLDKFDALRFVLPIGISFHIFQSISFLIDLYRGETQPARNIVDFAAFIALFPQLVAGPVVRYKDVADQFHMRTHSFDKFSEGARRFMIGFSKKILIADIVASLANAAFSIGDPHMVDAWTGTLAYTIQLYFDFSGYSDMAIGLAMMIGFRFPENFNAPYLSHSITEFWRRWHITLSAWLRDYLYIPLGGNRKGTRRTALNIFITMLLGGLWHGANWTFIAWGAFHGGLMVIERRFGIRNDPHETHKLLRHGAQIFTFFLVMMGWVLFRSDTIQTAFHMYQGIFGWNGIDIHAAFEWQVRGSALTALAIGCVLILIGPRLKNSHHPIFQLGTLALFLLAVSRMLAQNYSPFLYFQF